MESISSIEFQNIGEDASSFSGKTRIFHALHCQPKNAPKLASHYAASKKHTNAGDD
jgi:hypothetical protein